MVNITNIKFNVLVCSSGGKFAASPREAAGEGVVCFINCYWKLKACIYTFITQRSPVLSPS